MGARDSKTKPTTVSVETFLDGVAPPERQADARVLCALMSRLSGQPPVLWGPNIIGFGSRHYRYDSGREGDTLRIGFSPRKPSLVLYLHGAVARPSALLPRLGKYSAGKSCLYVKRLTDVDMTVMEALIAEAWAASLASDAVAA